MHMVIDVTGPQRTQVLDGLMGGELYAVIKQRRGELGACVQAQVQAGESSAITMDWIIGTDGNMKSVSVAESTSKLPALEKCFVNVMQAWSFPRPRDQGEVKARLVFSVEMNPAPKAESGEKPVLRLSEAPGEQPRDAQCVEPHCTEAGLTRWEIEWVIKRHFSQVRKCYEASFSKPPLPKGTVVTHWIIGPAGNVTTALVKNTTLNHPATEECIVNAIRSWTFEKPRNGSEVKVTYPFTFFSKN